MRFKIPRNFSEQSIYDGIGEGFVYCVNSEENVKKVLFKDRINIAILDSALLSL